MNLKKSISLVLTLCMVFSLFATFVFPVAAEDAPTYTLIDTVDGLTSGTYYMSGVVDTTYHVFTGSIGSGDLYTSAYAYTDGALSTEESYLAVAVEVAAVEGKENTYTLYVADKGYISCTDATNNRKLAFSDTAAEWVASANANGGINLGITVDGATAYMGTNSSASSKLIRQYKEASSANALTYGVVFFAEVVEEAAPVTSQVVTHWNTSEWASADEAHIFTDATAYAASAHTWWFHAAFAPTDVEGVYEVTAVRAPSESPMLTIPENGFVWVAHDTAAEGTAGAYSVAVLSNVAVGNKVTFTGLDIANCTTTADATAEKVVEEPVVDPNAPVSIALGKTYTYPTDGLYFHWSDEWPCTDNVATALTDGVKVAGYYGMGETSGWGGSSPNPLEVVIDLEAVYSIDSFAYTACGGATDPVDGISMPASVAIYVSEDGETFTQVDVSVVDGDPTYPIGWTTCADRTSVATATAAVEGRYVKFAFTRTGNFIFINELEVFGEEVPAPAYKEGLTIDLGENGMLHGNSAPNIEDNEAGLTDGTTTSTGFGTAGGAYLMGNKLATDASQHPVIDFIFNLGAATDVNTVTLDMYAEVGSMVGFPGQDAKVYVSEDGITWTLVESTNDIPLASFSYDDSSVNTPNGNYTATITLNETANAQYVKVGLSFPDSPFNDKVVWEWFGLTEIAVSYVEAGLNEVEGGALPAHNPRFNGALSVPANTAITYTVEFEDGANFSLWDENVSILVNGEALEMGALGYVAVLAKGDTLTIINENAEAVDTYPSISAIILGTMSAPIVLEELGDVTANLTAENLDGAVHYLYTATADGTLTITMPESGWTYTVNNLTASAYGDAQWSDSDPVVNPYVLEVAAGDEIMLIVAPYDEANQMNALGELTFNVAFEEPSVIGNVIVPDGWGTVDVLIDDYTGVGEITAHDNNHAALVPFKNADTTVDTPYSFIVPLAEATSFNTVTVYILSHTGGNVGLPKTLSVTINGKTYEAAAVTGDDASVVAIVVDLGETVEADKLTVNATIAAGSVKYNAYSEVEVSTATPKAPDVVDVLISHNSNFNWNTYEGNLIAALPNADNKICEVAGDVTYFGSGTVEAESGLYVVEKVDGLYVITEYVTGLDAMKATAIPEGGFLYFVCSGNSDWDTVKGGAILGYIFNLNDIDINSKAAIDTTANPAMVATLVNPEALKVGDVNMNGKIDATDYATIRKLVIGAADPADFSELALTLADVNGNGKIDANDYILVKRHFLGTYTIPAWAESTEE